MRGYLSVKKTAGRWSASVRRGNQNILAGRIPGCERLGHAWAIPEDAVKPERLRPGVKSKCVPADVEPDGWDGLSFFVQQLAVTNSYWRCFICLSVHMKIADFKTNDPVLCKCHDPGNDLRYMIMYAAAIGKICASDHALKNDGTEQRPEEVLCDSPG